MVQIFRISYDISVMMEIRSDDRYKLCLYLYELRDRRIFINYPAKNLIYNNYFNR